MTDEHTERWARRGLVTLGLLLLAGFLMLTAATPLAAQEPMDDDAEMDGGAEDDAEDTADIDDSAEVRAEERQEVGQYGEEIVVTARKREENLQEVPVAVTVTSGAVLEDAGSPDISVLQNYVPNLSVYSGRNQSTTLTAFMRGIGQAADGSYELNDRLTLNAGIRITEEEKRGRAVNAGYTDDTFSVINAIAADYDKSETFTSVAPKLGLDYKFSDDVLGYVSLSRCSAAWSPPPWAATTATTRCSPTRVARTRATRRWSYSR